MIAAFYFDLSPTERELVDSVFTISVAVHLVLQLGYFKAKLKKGVSAYTLVANHVPCNARIIGTHEHESHFVFDILHNNTTDIHPERHSTDTHGTHQLNFILLFV